MTQAKIADSTGRLPPSPQQASQHVPQETRRQNLRAATARITAAAASRVDTSAAKDETKATRAANTDAPAHPTRKGLHAPGQSHPALRDAADLVGTIKSITLPATDKQMAVQEAPLHAFAHPRASDNKLAVVAATESFAWASENDAMDRVVTAMLTIERTLQAAAQTAPARMRVKAGIGQALEAATKMAPERRAMIAPFLAQAYVQAGGDAHLQSMVQHVAESRDPVAAAGMEFKQSLRRGLGNDKDRAEAFMQEPGVQDLLRRGGVDLALMGMARSQGLIVPNNHFGRDSLVASWVQEQLAPRAPLKNRTLARLAQAADKAIAIHAAGKSPDLDIFNP